MAHITPYSKILRRYEFCFQVLLDFDWAKHYSDPETYFGTTSIKDPTTFHFPGMGAAGANALVERKIAGIYIASIVLDNLCSFLQAIDLIAVYT